MLNCVQKAGLFGTTGIVLGQERLKYCVSLWLGKCMKLTKKSSSKVQYRYEGADPNSSCPLKSLNCVLLLQVCETHWGLRLFFEKHILYKVCKGYYKNKILQMIGCLTTYRPEDFPP